MKRLFQTVCLGAIFLGNSTLSAAESFNTKRCMNMGNALDAPKEGEWGHTIQANSFRLVKEAGFDTVRIPIRWSAHTGGAPNYRINESFFARVDQVINQALSQNLQVIINVHHFEELNENPEDQLAKFIALWSQIAPRYAALPDTVYFEVLNEPNGKLGGDVMRKVLTAGFKKIRESNPTRILILGGEEWSGINSLPSIPAIDDPNQVYTFHYYDPFEFTHQKASWTQLKNSGSRGWGSREDKRQLKAAANYAAKTQKELDIPLFLGEIGAYEKAPYDDVVSYTRETRKAFEDAGISWCAWNFTATFPFYDQDSGQWDTQKLAALGLADTASNTSQQIKPLQKKETSLAFQGKSLDQTYLNIQRKIGHNAVIMMSPFVEELGSYGPASITTQKDNNVPEGMVLNIKTSKGENPWDSALSGAFIPPVKEGDAILMTYWAKVVDGPGEIASVGIQLAREPYSALSTRREILSHKWEQYFLTANADRDYAAEELGFTLQVAAAEQTLQIGPILIMNFGNNVSNVSLDNLPD